MYQMLTNFIISHVFLLLATAVLAEGNQSMVISNFNLETPPKRLAIPMQTFERILISGGPPIPYSVSKQAFQKPMLRMFEKAAEEIMEDIKEGLRYLFQTTNKYTLALPGTGHTAIDAVLDNIIEPGDVVLVPIYGIWGERITDSATRLGATVKNIRKPSLGIAFTLNDIEEAIKENKPNVVYLVNGESTTGAYQSVEGVGDLCRKYNCLLIVDLVATISVMPFYFDKWNIDAAFCNSQKGIGAPVGLAPVTFGPRAVTKILNRKTKPTSFRTDLKNWIETNYWKFEPNTPQTLLHSFPVLLFYTLREALALLTSETLQGMWAKHEKATTRFYEQFKELKLEYFVPDPKDRLTAVIAFYPPKGVVPDDFAEYLWKKHNMDISTGLGPVHGKILRVAFFSQNANSELVDLTITALKDALDHFKNLPLKSG